MPLTKEEIANRATYHQPSVRAVELHTRVRIVYEAGAHFINDNLPDCRESSTAQTKLEEFMFWANAAIARNHDKI